MTSLADPMSVGPGQGTGARHGARRPRPRLRRQLARTGIPALAAAGGLAALAATRAAARRH